ncbi:MAG: TPM domain-containing protein [Candidatus Aminicenantales bacterium]
MAIMSRHKLFKFIDKDQIRKSIIAAEKRTSGEICVSVAHFFWGRVRPKAERAFRRLGMANTRERNGILFFIVPARKRFVVLGDEGIHAKVGQEFWDGIAASMAGHFRKGEFQEGLLAGIQTAADGLAAHFPYEPATDVNELPDDIDFGKSP